MQKIPELLNLLFFCEHCLLITATSMKPSKPTETVTAFTTLFHRRIIAYCFTMAHEIILIFVLLKGHGQCSATTNGYFLLEIHWRWDDWWL